jgi:hypothetical protein
VLRLVPSGNIVVVACRYTEPLAKIVAAMPVVCFEVATVGSRYSLVLLVPTALAKILVGPRALPVDVLS